MTIYELARLSLALVILAPVSSYASKTSYHLASPLGWMYDLPVGETPGWTAPAWFNLEISHASIWNVPATFIDNRNSRSHGYTAIFEQTTGVAEIGVAPFESLSFAVEVPYAYRGGGVLGDFVKQFHYAVGSDTFERPDYQTFQNSYSVQTEGVNALDSDHGQGVSNLKFKVKWWLLPWKGDDRGSCDCGLAVSGQIKAPTARAAQGGMTSGSTDVSGLVHLGVPLFEQSGIWLTAAFTQLGQNEIFRDWPMRRSNQMYEFASDFGITDNVGLILQARYVSPMMNEGDLRFHDPLAVDTLKHALDREASGWNSMVYWTGSETVGFRYRWGEGSQISFLFEEDFAVGTYDQRADWVYCNNAPDFSFLAQFHFLL